MRMLTSAAAPGFFTVTLGAGGAAVSGDSPGADGGPSVLQTSGVAVVCCALDGGRGGGWSANAGRDAGQCGSGSASNSGGGVVPMQMYGDRIYTSTGRSVFASSGGWGSYYGGGGGGGAAGGGGNACYSGANWGDGYPITITRSTIYAAQAVGGGAFGGLCPYGGGYGGLGGGGNEGYAGPSGAAVMAVCMSATRH